MGKKQRGVATAAAVIGAASTLGAWPAAGDDATAAKKETDAGARDPVPIVADVQPPPPPPPPPPETPVGFFPHIFIGPAVSAVRQGTAVLRPTYGLRLELLVPRKTEVLFLGKDSPSWAVGPYAEIASNGSNDLLLGGGLSLHAPTERGVALSVGGHATDLNPWNPGLDGSLYLDLGGANAAGFRLGMRWGLGREEERVGFVAFELNAFAPFAVFAIPFVNWGRMPSGRPVRDARGEAILPAIASRGSMPRRRARTRGLAAKERAHLAQAWLEDAVVEHASIASFSRLALDLLHVGAPPDLVDACHCAALDEVRHAARCFALASCYAGRPLSAGAMGGLAAAPGARPLHALLFEAIVDGVLGEGLAAAVAADMAPRAADPLVRTALREIAADEARHAALAWRVVELGAARLPTHEAWTVVVRALASFRSPTAPRAPVGARRLAAHGRPSQARIDAAARRVRFDAVRRLRALLGEAEAPARDGARQPAHAEIQQPCSSLARTTTSTSIESAGRLSLRSSSACRS